MRQVRQLNTRRHAKQRYGRAQIKRGYLPVLTHSSHYIRDPGLKRAVENFLVREREQITDAITMLSEDSPYKDRPDAASALRLKYLARKG
jgi:predicted N-acyltransferase